MRDVRFSVVFGYLGFFQNVSVLLGDFLGVIAGQGVHLLADAFDGGLGRFGDVRLALRADVRESLLEVVVTRTDGSSQPIESIFDVPLDNLAALRGSASHLHQLLGGFAISRELLSGLAYLIDTFYAFFFKY